MNTNIDILRQSPSYMNTLIVDKCFNTLSQYIYLKKNLKDLFILYFISFFIRQVCKQKTISF